MVGADTQHIPFANLRRGHEALRSTLLDAIAETFDSGWYILGERLASFEEAFRRYCGASFAIGVASGTDALHLALLAAGICPGDEVITVSNTFVATALAIRYAGATPVFAEVDDNTHTMLPSEIERLRTAKTRAVLPVHLFGRMADMRQINAIADRHGLAVIEDACQAHGARVEGRMAGTFGLAGCFSFYPTKNLGACGDGGIIVTDDLGVAERARSLRNYGQSQKYHHECIGFNSRLDEMQAAILEVKLSTLDGRNDARRRIARRYTREIANLHVITPGVADGDHVFHLYVVRSAHRDSLQKWLAGMGVDTQIHYPVAIHNQPAFAEFRDAALPVTDRLQGEVLSLPLYPELTENEIDRVVRAVNDFRPS
jgi:dTDP-4-amino-4,6-dideoxygalactose transaminase